MTCIYRYNRRVLDIFAGGLVYYRSVYGSIAERIFYPKSALRFSQIHRGADNGFPDFADFDSAAGMVEKIYETPAKVYQGMVQKFCSARNFVRFYVASSGCWFLTF